MQVTRSCLVGALLAIVIPVGTFLTTAGIMMIPPDTQGVSLIQGRDLFRANCGSCHFAKIGFPAHHGPNLHDIGRTGARRRPGMSAPAYILESILDPAEFVAPSSRPGMPRNVVSELAPDEVRNIVGFLASRGAHPDYSEIIALDIPDRRTPAESPRLVRREDMLQAVDVLRNKGGCLQCHSRDQTPESTVLAPGLFNVGLIDEQLVRKSITKPYAEVKPSYRATSVVLQSGKVLTGSLVARNDNHLLLCLWNESGSVSLRKIPLADVETDDGRLLVEESEVSIMPTGFDKLLSDEEIRSVVTLIQQLN